MWAVQATKMGYKWRVGNGQKIKFCEDIRLGSSSLAIQYWPLYRIVNEKGKSIADLYGMVIVLDVLLEEQFLKILSVLIRSSRIDFYCFSV
jgi:hypothetical protein